MPAKVPKRAWVALVLLLLAFAFASEIVRAHIQDPVWRWLVHAAIGGAMGAALMLFTRWSVRRSIELGASKR